MKRLQVLFTILVICCYSQCYSQNPFVTHIYAADPSAHVWPSDTTTLWLYTSHDVPGNNHHATMFDYHVFATKDLINWIDYGRVLSVDDVDWAIDYAWAIDAVYRHGMYYLIFCMHDETGIFRTGVAVSNVPQGPFKNIGYIKGVDWGQDPAVFVDEDGKAYLYWGSGGKCEAAELNDDLLSIKPETKVSLTSQLFEIFEGPWVHKYKEKYYLSYPGLPKGQWPEEMYYAISDKPLGPYKYQGIYIPKFEGQAGTNHGSIVFFKNMWFAFHHSAIGSNGNGSARSLMADYLTYNSDGTIKSIIPNSKGISKGLTVPCSILLEAENAPAAGGKLVMTQVENNTPGFLGKGYITGFDKRFDYAQVLVQVGKNMKAMLKIKYSADEDSSVDILVGAHMLNGWNGTKLKKTKGWEEIDLGNVQLKEGDNLIRINSHTNVNLKIDYFKLLPE